MAKRPRRPIAWELAAKIEPEGVEYVYGDERWPNHEIRARLVRGLVATGMVRLYGRGFMCAWLIIQFYRGRQDDPDAPWSLGAFKTLDHAPSVAEVFG